MSDSLLPPNATAQEKALEAATERMAGMDVPLRPLWNADACPPDLLPWLAWAFGVDEWDDGWGEDAKRSTIKNAVTIHRRKGTVWAVKRAIAAAGYGDGVLLEGDSINFYDGVKQHGGSSSYGNPTDWALYRFLLPRPISNAQAAQIRRLLGYTAPTRCHLIELIFIEAANLYDEKVTYNGSYNHGVA